MSSAVDLLRPEALDQREHGRDPGGQGLAGLGQARGGARSLAQRTAEAPSSARRSADAVGWATEDALAARR